MYIRAPTIRHNLTVYLSPALLVSSVFSEIITALLRIERAVSYCTSLLPRFPFFPFSDLQVLLDTLDVAVVVKSDYLTPNKNKSFPS